MITCRPGLRKRIEILCNLCQNVVFDYETGNKVEIKDENSDSGKAYVSDTSLRLGFAAAWTGSGYTLFKNLKLAGIETLSDRRFYEL